MKHKKSATEGMQRTKSIPNSIRNMYGANTTEIWNKQSGKIHLKKLFSATTTLVVPERFFLPVNKHSQV
jgi:hypothetical protein